MDPAKTGAKTDSFNAIFLGRNLSIHAAIGYSTRPESVCSSATYEPRKALICRAIVSESFIFKAKVCFYILIK
jgi:hypothetical protein